MSKVLVTESNLQDIADAIRSKSESVDVYHPGDMAAAILAIPTGAEDAGAVRFDRAQGLTDAQKEQARANIGAADVYSGIVLVIDCGTISSLPTTINHADITADMVLLKAVIGNPSAQADDNWQAVTAAGTVTISGTISGSTSLVLYLTRAR